MEKRLNPFPKHLSLALRDYIPFLGGRPGRILPIDNQDIMDLKIDLWTSPSVDDFLEHLK